MTSSEPLPPICVLAGGLGTRLGAQVAKVPKPLLEVAGEPFLLHQLRLLAGYGAQRVILCVSYLGEQIEARIGYRQFGIEIGYSYDVGGPEGTLGAIRRALPLLSDRFLVLYGDTYLRLDYRAASRRWETSALPALMTVLRNDGQWDRSNALYDDGRVVAYDKGSPTPEMRWIDYGLGGLEVRALELAGPVEDDLAALYRRLARDGRLCGYEVTERFFEIGTPAGLADTDQFLRTCR